MGVGWSGWIEVETTARNRRANRKDVLGQRPKLLVVEQGGPSTIPTRLPVEDIVRRIHEVGIPVRTSDDAGGYLCNDAFYIILRATEGETVPAGFIHLPRARPDPSIRPSASERDVEPVDLDGLVRAIRAAIEETAAACPAL
jgi:pyroglutamyl-peptidase